MSVINKLSFIKKQQESDDVYTFFFQKPNTLQYKAGQHGLFILTGLYRPHPFTLSSSPEEQYISITTHVNTGSKYKQKLMTMNEDNSIILLGPILNFTFVNNAKNYVFLAQGVGITPFRSMLVHAHAHSLKIKTTLIHVDSKTHAFKSVTQQYATNAHYPTNPDDFKQRVSEQNTDQLFYLSGSPKFIAATKTLLAQQGVKSHNIKTDSFLGY